jgi:hypothetical protein
MTESAIRYESFATAEYDDRKTMVGAPLQRAFSAC